MDGQESLLYSCVEYYSAVSWRPFKNYGLQNYIIYSLTVYRVMVKGFEGVLERNNQNRHGHKSTWLPRAFLRQVCELKSTQRLARLEKKCWYILTLSILTAQQFRAQFKSLITQWKEPTNKYGGENEGDFI